MTSVLWNWTSSKWTNSVLEYKGISGGVMLMQHLCKAVLIVKNLTWHLTITAAVGVSSGISQSKRFAKEGRQAQGNWLLQFICNGVWALIAWRCQEAGQLVWETEISGKGTRVLSFHASTSAEARRSHRLPRRGHWHCRGLWRLFMLYLKSCNACVIWEWGHRANLCSFFS